MKKAQNFQEFIYSLCQYWIKQGCIWSQPYDQPMGAGTFHPHTFFKALGTEPWRAVYVQPCRRPVDGRYGKSPNRLQYYYQLQVILKPAPADILDVYLNSLQHIGISLKKNDVALYEDNWQGPTLGAWGLGWEVRANGQEVTQFTYFQEFAGLKLPVISGEITYGLERLFMYAHGYQNVMDIPFNEHFTYGDIFYRNEFEFSQFNFKSADTKELFETFNVCEQNVLKLCEQKLVLPAYDYVLQASHAFNMLDARGAISVTERQRFIGRVRDCAKSCANLYCEDSSVNDAEDASSTKQRSSTSARSRNLSAGINLKLRNKKSSVPVYHPEKDFNHLKSVNVILELGVEEMPPNFQISAFKSLEIKIAQGKNKFVSKYVHGNEFIDLLNLMDIQVFISPRRIAFQCAHVPKNTPPQTLELWGPAESIAKDSAGKLTPAGSGFCKKNNLHASDVEFKQKGNTNFLYAQKNIEPSDFPTLLVNELKNYIYALDIPLKMHWLPEQTSPAFVRPVRWILCLIENKVLPLEMFGLKSSSFTHGQRILNPEAIEVKHAYEYEKKIRKANVILSQDERKSSIVNQSEMLMKKLGQRAEIVPDFALLEKCIGFTENPHVFLGNFDQKYTALPAKLIVSVLKEHMNYFSIHDVFSKELLPYYIGVASYHCQNVRTMVSGTQKVVASRLEDGAFYFENDLTIPFFDLREKLKNQIFQEGLGTLFDKSERISIFATWIAELLHQQNKNSISREDIQCLMEAGKHCKNDLKSGCVQEFPDEMQGVMGGVLVRKQNVFEDPEKSERIAQAIEEHYSPFNAQSSLPSSPLARILALADKMDSLVLMLSAGYAPTGNQDPFGVRRLAIAIARLLNLKNEDEKVNFVCSFEDLFDLWESKFSRQFKCEQSLVKNFFLDRVKALLKEDFNPNSVESISSLILVKPLKIFKPLLTALEKNLANSAVLVPYKRARSMTQGVEEKTLQYELLTTAAEKELYESFCAVKTDVQQFFEQEKFDLFFESLSSLTLPLARFFDAVLVNDENLEIRHNRLQLLIKIRRLYEDFVDLSNVQIVL